MGKDTKAPRLPSNSNEFSGRLPVRPVSQGSSIVPNKLPTGVPRKSLDRIRFSFSLLDREMPEFNLGAPGGADGFGWFLDLLDCLKSVSSHTYVDLKNSKKYQLHPVDWKHCNVKKPFNTDDEQADYWQFRINKSKGRVIGIKIDSVFYIVWLDRNHNLCNSDGYGVCQFYQKPPSGYELLVEEIKSLKAENASLLKDMEQYTAPAQKQTLSQQRKK